MALEYASLAGLTSGLGHMLAGIWSALVNPLEEHPILFAAAGLVLLTLALARRR